MRLAKEHAILDEYPIDWLAFGRIGKPKHELPDRCLAGKLWTSEQIWSVLDALSAKAIIAGQRDLCRLIWLTGLRLDVARRMRQSWVHPTRQGSKAAALRTAELPGVLTPRDLRHRCLTQVERETGSMESARALAGTNQPRQRRDTCTLTTPAPSPPDWQPHEMPKRGHNRGHTKKKSGRFLHQTTRP